MAAIAQARLPLEQVRRLECSIFDSRLPDASFDFAIARLVFQHLPDPLYAAREVLRLLREEGTLAVIDIDAGLIGITEPFFPNLYPIYRKTEPLQSRLGGDRTVGRRLWRILRDAGFQDPTLEAFVYHSDEIGVAAFAQQLSPNRVRRALDVGLITSDEFSQLEAAHQEFLKSPNAFVLMVGLIAHGKKPSQGRPR
jgi:ubiquinone/menaquinone biosynthesis C-methylase UbiE